LFDKDWRKVSEFVGTRTNIQCRTHAQKHFKGLEARERKIKSPSKTTTICPPKLQPQQSFPPLQQQPFAGKCATSMPLLQRPLFTTYTPPSHYPLLQPPSTYPQHQHPIFLYPHQAPSSSYCLPQFPFPPPATAVSGVQISPPPFGLLAGERREDKIKSLLDLF
jgi:hypothetical protein